MLPSLLILRSAPRRVSQPEWRSAESLAPRTGSARPRYWAFPRFRWSGRGSPGSGPCSTCAPAPRTRRWCSRRRSARPTRSAPRARPCSRSHLRAVHIFGLAFEFIGFRPRLESIWQLPAAEDQTIGRHRAADAAGGAAAAAFSPEAAGADEHVGAADPGAAHGGRSSVPGDACCAAACVLPWSHLYF